MSNRRLRTMNTRFISLVEYLIIALVLASVSAHAQTLPGTKPNVIVINADDLGYGDLGCYGQKLFKTPNLDRMASEGKRFTNFYAGCSVCTPSRACLLTGKDTGHVSLRGNVDTPLSLDDKTIAEVLKPAGYRSG